MRNRGTRAWILLAALTVSGCGASEEAISPDTGSSPAAQPDRPAPAVPESPSAADGTDVAACFDGRCQIAVSGSVVIPLDGRAGIAELAVDKVDPDTVGVTTTSTEGSRGSGETDPGCTMTFRRNGGGSACGGTLLNSEGLTVRVLTVSQGTAILDLSTQ